MRVTRTFSVSFAVQSGLLLIQSTQTKRLGSFSTTGSDRKTKEENIIGKQTLDPDNAIKRRRRLMQSLTNPSVDNPTMMTRRLKRSVGGRLHEMLHEKETYEGMRSLPPKDRKDCNPMHFLATSTDEKESADIGVLSCGFYEYCAESSQSSLGGYCVSIANDILNEGMQSSPRELQDTSFTVDSLVQLFCQDENATCTCTNIDRINSSQTLTVNCVNDAPHCYDYTNKCDFSIYGCSTFHYILDFQENSQSVRKRVYEQSQPYYERVVYTGIANAGSTDITNCTVEFNGILCHSCQVVPQLIEDKNSTSSLYWPCYQFDCSNTMGGHRGNTCKLDASKMFEHITYYGCPTCNVCDGQGGLMTTVGASVDLYGAVYSCGDLGRLGIDGRLNFTECEIAQTYAASSCGCTSV